MGPFAIWLEKANLSNQITWRKLDADLTHLKFSGGHEKHFVGARAFPEQYIAYMAVATIHKWLQPINRQIITQGETSFFEEFDNLKKAQTVNWQQK